MQRFLRFFSSGLSVINVLFLVSCTKVEPPAPQKAVSNLRIGTTGSCKSFDPLLETKDICLSLSKLLYPTLTQTHVTASEAVVEPQLAERWVFESPNRIKIQLRKDLNWSNGAPLHVSHFLARWKRILSTPNLSHLAPFLFSIKNARNYYEHKVAVGSIGWTEADSTSLVLDLESTETRILEDLSHIALSPEYPLRPPEVVPTLGAYILENYEKSFGATFKSNPVYPHPRVPFKKIDLFYYPNAREAFEQLKDGSLELLVDEKNTTDKTVGDFGSWRHDYPSGLTLQLLLNPRKRIFSFRRSRLAFLTSLQRDEVLGLFPWNHKLGPAPALPKSENGTDLAFIQSLFAKSDTLILSHPVFEEALEVAENIRAQWAKHFGITFELAPTLSPFPPGGSSDSSAAIVTSKELRNKDPFALRPIWEHILFKNLTSTAEYIPYEASLMPWLTLSQESLDGFQEWMTSKEFFLLPLITLTKTAYLSPSLKGLEQDIFYLWNFSELASGN